MTFLQSKNITYQAKTINKGHNDEHILILKWYSDKNT